MELKCRLTRTFADIKVDEVETTVHKSDTKEVDKMIYNLLAVIDDLAKLTGKEFSFSLNDAEYDGN